MKPLLAAAAALLSACAPPPALPVAGADPSDPAAKVPAARYAPVTAGTADHRPAALKPWLERNRAVAPRSKEGL